MKTNSAYANIDNNYQYLPIPTEEIEEFVCKICSLKNPININIQERKLLNRIITTNKKYYRD